MMKKKRDWITLNDMFCPYCGKPLDIDYIKSYMFYGCGVSCLTVDCRMFARPAISVRLSKISAEKSAVKKWDRIAKQYKTARGDSGFGSTGR